MRVEDAELVSRCLEGDTESYGELVKRYQGSVFATAYYYIGNYASAEDVTQDALLAAYKGLTKLRRREAFGPWLKEITCRTSANWLRKYGKSKSNETPLPHRRTISIEDAREDPRGYMERQERFAAVQKAVDSLPERYRLPVVLRYLQEMSYEEISSFTGETREEIRGVLQRAGRQLRDILGDLDSAAEGDIGWHPAGR